MTYFLYDGLTPIAETDGNGNVTAVNTWGVNGLASRRNVSTNASTFYSFDVQGSTVQRLDSSGNVLGSYGYDAFGVRVGTDSSTDPYCGYGAQAGYYRDCETGLSLLGHRYYNPSQGRFLNRDPIGYNGGLNLYAYTGSNPLKGIDPQGQETEFWDGVGTGFDPHSFGGIPEAGSIPEGGIGAEGIGGEASSAEACPSEATTGEPVESTGEPTEYYRAVGDSEAEAIRESGGAVKSVNAFRGGNITRIFASSAMEQMRQYFNLQNSQQPGTYTHLVTFTTYGDLQLAQEAPYETYFVDVPVLNNALVVPPTISPINGLIAGDPVNN
jgi:RHS repeat-associated protein